MSEQYLARTTSFVRRGERMTRSQDRAWREHAEHFVAPLRRTDSRTTVDPDERLNLDALFGGRGGDLVVEIGTGTGDQIVHAATQRPDRRYLGFEVWRPGIAQAIVKAQHAGVDNVRFVDADAEQALRTLLPDASVSEVWTFFPDPWQKKRHHKRRLVKEGFADDVAAVLVDGGAWRLATDWRAYASHMIHVLAAHKDFDAYNRGRFDGRTLTKFERRANDEGHFPYDLVAIRHARLP